MFRNFALIFVFLTTLVPLQAGTIHEVFNQTYTLTGALNTTDLLTPPAVDTSYLITIYYTVSGTSGVGVKDVVSPYFNWTDAAGVEQLGMDFAHGMRRARRKNALSPKPMGLGFQPCRSMAEPQVLKLTLARSRSHFPSACWRIAMSP